MRNVIYSMQASLDGFIAGPDGDLSWSVPDEELHRFHNERTREADVHVYGRRLYEVMRYWESYEAKSPAAPEHEVEFARIWRATPKLVFSRTLERVEGKARLAGDDLAGEMAELRRQPGSGDIAVGGADLASSLTELGLVDEYRLFVVPVVLGGGTPYLRPLEDRVELELVETRTFSSGVTYLRYRAAGRP